MSHSYVSNHLHCVFSTKKRIDMITPEIKKRLFPYLTSIAQENKMMLLESNGTANHVHLLLSLPSTLTLAKGIQLLKGNSSKWINETFSLSHRFSWQAGYGGFGVNISLIPETIQYIKKQEEHHRKISFEEEFIQFLRKHNIEYDERYIWE